MDDRFGLFRQSAARREETAQTRLPMDVSLWLYLAGFLVTLSGLYAVNFSLGDANFATLSYSLATAGFVFSTLARVRQMDLNSIKTPLLVSIALLALAAVSGSGTGWLLPAGLADNSVNSLQVLFAWVAILHTFLLVNDASVLFACVPAMTLLALVSTQSPEPEVQNAFLIFIAASTFLMVHENFLRTRMSKTLRRGVEDRPLFGGQVLLAAACLVGALILANVVAIPIKAFGQTLFDASMGPDKDSVTRTKAANLFAKNFNEITTLNLAQGPVAESDTPLLRIQSSRGMYWRGTTFSNYTGHSFDNQPLAPDARLLTAQKQSASQDMKPGQYAPANGPGSISESYVYDLPLNRYELPPSEMKDSVQEKQSVQVIGGVFSNLYGAAPMRKVTLPLSEMHTNDAGSLFVNVPASLSYEVVSQVPTQDEKKLRQASSSLQDVPEEMRSLYLQLPGEHEDEIGRVKQLALSLTRNKTNNFDKAEALRKYIAAECKYNLQVSRAPQDRDVVAWFLLEKKEGYCDSFAAAMTMLCRYANIPARLASGFLPGDIESDGVYIVREKHKHVWTEVFFPHIGWVPFDATDGTVDISDRGKGTKKAQGNFVGWLTSHGSLPLVMALVLAAMLGYVVKTEIIDRLRTPRSAQAEAPTRPLTNLQVMGAYAQTELLFRRRGLPRLAHQTPDEYSARLAQRLGTVLPDVSRNMEGLTALYTLYRYGRDVATREEAETSQQLAASIRDSLQAVKPREFAEIIQKV